MDGPGFIPPNPQIKQPPVADKQATDKVRANQLKENSEKSGAKGPSSQDKSQAADKFEQLAKDKANKANDAEKRDTKEQPDKKPQPEKSTDAKEKSDKSGTKNPSSQDKSQAAGKFEQLAKDKANKAKDTGTKNSADQPALKNNAEKPGTTKGSSEKTQSTNTHSDAPKSTDNVDQNNSQEAGNDKRTKLTAEQKSKKHQDEIRARIMKGAAENLAGKLGLSDVGGSGSDTDVHLVDKKDKGKGQQAGNERAKSGDKNANTDRSQPRSPSSQEKQHAADNFEQIARDKAEKGKSPETTQENRETSSGHSDNPTVNTKDDKSLSTEQLFEKYSHEREHRYDNISDEHKGRAMELDHEIDLAEHGQYADGVKFLNNEKDNFSFNTNDQNKIVLEYHPKGKAETEANEGEGGVVSGKIKDIAAEKAIEIMGGEAAAHVFGAISMVSELNEIAHDIHDHRMAGQNTPEARQWQENRKVEAAAELYTMRNLGKVRESLGSAPDAHYYYRDNLINQYHALGKLYREREAISYKNANPPPATIRQGP